MKNPIQPGHSNGVLSGKSAGQFATNTLDRAATEQVDILVTAGEGLVGRILRGPTPGKRFSFFLLVPALIAFCISCYLAFAALTAAEVAGCGSGQFFDCSHVLQSKYSKWMGVPVSIFAAANYVVMLISLSVICFSNAAAIARKISWAAIAFCGIVAGMAAIWFIGLQAFVLGHFCPWCLAAHSCGLVIATAILIKRPFGVAVTLSSSGFAAIAITGLIVGQIMSVEPAKFKIVPVPPVEKDSANDGSPTDLDVDEGDLFSPPMEEDGNIFEAPMDSEVEEPMDSMVERKSTSLLATSLMGLFSSTSMVTWNGPVQEEAKQEEAKQEEAKQEEAKQEEADDKPKVERRTIKILRNVELDPKQWPLLGSPGARYIFVEMFDYGCPHCRATHSAIKGASESMGKELAIIVLPVPLNSRCNSAITRTGAHFAESCEMAKLAVACWRVDPAQFQVFHHWMFEGASCPTYAKAKAKVDQLVGRDKIDTELRKEAAGKYVKKHVQLYQRAGRGVVPKLLFPTQTIEGEYTSTSSLVNMIRNQAK